MLAYSGEKANISYLEESMVTAKGLDSGYAFDWLKDQIQRISRKRASNTVKTGVV
jgi:hypothetical protein